jgi:G3E family GTPase
MAKQLSSPAHRKSEVIIISGFLGAGKTTLLKKILLWESDLSETVVIVNEFGDVGIDGSLLKKAGSDVVELTGGCICCTLKADLNLTLKKIWRQFNPKRIFIETTGVADPFMITDVFDDPELHDQMKVFKVITVLDIELWEARECFGTVFSNQLQQADLILLNKIDVADENKISQFLKEIHETVPNSQVVPTIHCNVDPEIVLTGRTKIPLLANYDELNHHHYDHKTQGENQDDYEKGSFPYISFSFRSSDALDEECFKLFAENLPWELFRMKGPVRFRDRTVFVNYVGGNNEWSVWDDFEETCLVFVGWKVGQEETIRNLKNCIIPDPSLYSEYGEK